MDPAMDDLSLLLAYRAGRIEAFEAIVRRHYGALLRTAEQRCGAGALAEDAVQAALVRAHRYLRRGRGVENLGAWLRRVVVNCASDLLRERGRAATPIAQEPESSASGAALRLEGAELRGLVASAIERLPEVYRAPLALALLEGMEAKEVAAQLHDNVNSVKSRIARGRRELRRRLEGTLRKAGWL